MATSPPNTTTTMIKNTITPRLVDIYSDNKEYHIVGKLIANQDGYSRDMGATYKGSNWVVSLYHKGKRVNGIQVNEGSYAPYVWFKDTEHNMTLNKNYILYLAEATHMFKEALANIDTKKVIRQWYKEYVNARIADGTL